jgi:hypothetical protein
VIAQEGAGHLKVIAYGSDPATCPVPSPMRESSSQSCSARGALFRPINRHEQLYDKRLTDFAVAFIIKRVAKKAGLAAPQLSGHSLRAGFVTEAPLE